MNLKVTSIAKQNYSSKWTNIMKQRGKYPLQL